MGATAIVTQIVFLREFLNVFQGNELVIGIVLSLWMAITGLGALTGRLLEKGGQKIAPLSTIPLVLGLLPLVTAFYLRYARNLLLEPGMIFDLAQFIVFSFLFLLPFCFTAGFAFPFLVRAAFTPRANKIIPRLYAWEALGSVLGGSAFSILAAYFIPAFKMLTFLALFNCVAALFLALKEKACIPFFFSLFLLIGGGLSLKALNLDLLTRAYLFPHERIIYFQDTPYGNVTVTTLGAQKNFYENGLLLSSSEDIITAEESVHYAMAQHPAPRYVLLISGGFLGLTAEILKYPVKEIHYVELNPALTEIGRLYTPHLSDPRIRIVNMDARLFLRQKRHTYDVVLMNLPEPQTAQVNRLYTDEFFQELKCLLEPKAIVSLSLPSSADYLSYEARELKGSILKTLKKNFHHVHIFPGEKDFMVASDTPIETNITTLIEEKGLPTRYVNKYYLSDEVLARRSKFITERLEKRGAVNKDFFPIAYHRSLLLWISQFDRSIWAWPIAAFALIIMAVTLRYLTPITAGIFVGGFSASALEVVLLLSFQVLYGFVYQMLSIIITAFMAGLAFGALGGARWLSGNVMKKYILSQYALAFLSFLLPLLLLGGKVAIGAHISLTPFFIVTTFILAGIIGTEFSFASHLSAGTPIRRAAQIYGLDLIGSALGAIIVSVFIIPLWGLLWSCTTLGCLNAISGTIAFLYRKG